MALFQRYISKNRHNKNALKSFIQQDLRAPSLYRKKILSKNDKEKSFRIFTEAILAAGRSPLVPLTGLELSNLFFVIFCEFKQMAVLRHLTASYSNSFIVILCMLLYQ